MDGVRGYCDDQESGFSVQVACSYRLRLSRQTLQDFVIRKAVKLAHGAPCITPNFPECGIKPQREKRLKAHIQSGAIE
jgi:hypothetical protein